MYQQTIREMAALLGRIGVNPRHVEAWMRVEHSTLDWMDRERFRLEVEIRMTFRGVLPRPADMPFPPILSAPWRLNRNQCSEDGIPQRVSTGQAASQDEWERSARLIYESSVAPTASTLEPLRNPTTTVLSYFL